MMRCNRSQPAFTLIELVLVLLLLAIVAGSAVPSLRDWSRGGKLDNAADAFLASTRWARSQAIASATTHRIEVETNGAHRVAIREGQIFSPVSGEMGHWTPLPTGIALSLTRTDGGTPNTIDFYANGRVSPAEIILRDEFGQTVRIVAATPAETFRRIGGRP